MSVKKNKETGKWDVQMYIKDPDGSVKHTRRRGFKSRESALQYELDHKQKEQIDTSKTFGQMFESMCLKNLANDVTNATRRQRLKKYATDLWDKPISKLSKNDLLVWREDLEKCKKLGTLTKNDIIGYVKAVFKYGYEVFDTYDSGKILKPIPKELKDYRQYIILTVDQFKALLDAEPSEECRDIFTVLYMTGARKGEIRALKKTDYDPKTKQLYLGKSIRRYASSLKTPKNPGSIRYVPIDNQTAAIFEKLQKRKGEWMFGDYTPISLTTMQSHFKNALKAADLNPDTRIHDLRHSHVSLLWNAKVPIPEIAKRIGHSSPAQTMRTYAHLFDNKQSASISALNSVNLKKVEPK